MRGCKGRDSREQVSVERVPSDLRHMRQRTVCKAKFAGVTNPDAGILPAWREVGVNFPLSLRSIQNQFVTTRMPMKFSFNDQQLRYRPTHVGWRGAALKIVTGLAATIFLVATVAFSLIAVAFVGLVLLGVGLYFWWQTRDLRRQIRSQMQAATRNEGEVIDGEVIRTNRTGRHRPEAREIRVIDSEIR